MRSRPAPLHVPELQIVVAIVAFGLLSWPLVGDVADHAGAVVMWLFGAWAIVIVILIAIQATARTSGGPNAPHRRPEHTNEEDADV